MKWLAITLVLATGIVYAEEQPAAADEPKPATAERADATWSKLSPEAKTRLIRLHDALTQMPPEERKFIHDRVERFLNMSPEERDQIRKNAERWRNMSPEEREQARQQFRQRREEFEKKWREEHPGEEPPFPPRGHRPPPPHPDDSEPKPEHPVKENP